MWGVLRELMMFNELRNIAEGVWALNNKEVSILYQYIPVFISFILGIVSSGLFEYIRLKIGKHNAKKVFYKKVKNAIKVLETLADEVNKSFQVTPATKDRKADNQFYFIEKNQESISGNIDLAVNVLKDLESLALEADIDLSSLMLINRKMAVVKFIVKSFSYDSFSLHSNKQLMETKSSIQQSIDELKKYYSWYQK